MDTAAATEMARSLEQQRERLLPCVHCGFCLAACPTYSRLGDEADSPRGRIHLMQAVVEGRLDAASDAFQMHIDRCLGCRACETVCPSGVEYGQLIELARDVAAKGRAPSLLTRLLLVVFSSRALRRVFFFGGTVMRASGMAGAAARLLPGRGLLGSARLGMAMVAATAPWTGLKRGAPPEAAGPPPDAEAPPRRGRVAILEGCVQEGLYGRVNAATVRVLQANGFEVVTVRGQECCGALHAHSGDLEGARARAKLNVECFEASGVDRVVVNAAGCGATMKEYAHLLSHDPAFEIRAAALSAKVRDVHELLAEVGPRPGAPVPCRVAFDFPCHLLHAQRIREAPLTVLAAVPGVEVRVIDDAAECCGGAGIYGITHPELGGHIGRDKIASVRRAECDVVATPNPGCMMQIGAGLTLEGAREGVIHPIEVLDESYRRAGYYA